MGASRLLVQGELVRGELPVPTLGMEWIREWLRLTSTMYLQRQGSYDLYLSNRYGTLHILRNRLLNDLRGVALSK